MQTSPSDNSVARGIAHTMIRGFNKHYRIFRETSMRAKARFEQAHWPQQLQAVRERVQFYDDRVSETTRQLQEEFSADSLDDATWQQAKLHFIGMLIDHKQPELAETFFNSITTKILHRSYFHNAYLFARPAIATEYIDSDPPVYRSYYAQEGGLRTMVLRIIRDFGWERHFEDIERDVERILCAARMQLGGWPSLEVNFQLQVLCAAFYRNKSAYIIGKAVNGYQEIPFTLAVRHSPAGALYVDTLLLDTAHISALFSLSRAYFLVDMEVPSGYVQFLMSIMPYKPRSEIYTMLGLGKQGKTMFYRDLTAHLRHSNDQFVIAPGIRGLVMLVFTLPSYPYVFKLIKDVFGVTKTVDRATVKRKYLMVKQVDRVGRMADTLEFSFVGLPLARFHPELLEELRTLAPSSFEIEGDMVVIRHLYIERRMTPLNIHIEHASDEELEHAVIEYGNAIRELAIANIFTGDMLWKNFGITRYGRVVFYDYDEIEYMTDVNFRRIPPAPYPEMEMSGDAWYSASPGDIFPEEFGTFLLGAPRVREVFMKHHRDLLDPAFWQRAQQSIRNGFLEDFFPYPAELRFNRLFASDGPSETDEADAALKRAT